MLAKVCWSWLQDRGAWSGKGVVRKQRDEVTVNSNQLTVNT